MRAIDRYRPRTRGCEAAGQCLRTDRSVIGADHAETENEHVLCFAVACEGKSVGRLWRKCEIVTLYLIDLTGENGQLSGWRREGLPGSHLAASSGVSEDREDADKAYVICLFAARRIYPHLESPWG